MATHSRVLTWRIPGTGEPGGLPSMGSHGVGHDWSDLAAVAARYLKISFISRHTWMIAWLSRILDYQSYFGTAGSFFFFFQYFGDVIQLSSAEFSDVCTDSETPESSVSFLESLHPCVQLCVWPRNQQDSADIWVSFSVQWPSPEYLTHQCQLS